MFRGAYLINKVSHSITPHNMSTTFKGQRIKNTKITLIDESQLFMNLLGPLESAGAAETINDSTSKGQTNEVITSNVQTTNQDTQVTSNNVQTNLVSTTNDKVATSSSSTTGINTDVNTIII